MKLYSQLILAASLVSLVACSETKKAETTATVGKTPVNFSAPSAQPQQSGTTASGLNPAHGQPGHRCDIPVGAALSTPAKSDNAAAATTLPTQTPVVPTPAPTTTATAPGMNPPHGQPGHDCSIAVGAPLNK